MLQTPPIAELPIFLFVLFMLSVIQGLKRKKKKKTLRVCGNLRCLALSSIGAN